MDEPIDLEAFEKRYRDALTALDKSISEEVKRDREFWDDFARRHGITPSLQYPYYYAGEFTER